ncbi:NTP transferase domain-containing protein [Pelagicoccus sp. SDUM812003]|uniref:molybdenum cofactor guanylyltransferase n=1 Tax=Pelagicoccus sp. SDUM812003 TaxID=3041267 RepID=UPI00280DF5BC|nr:NTP transferase domain-containing protein [Pelagicoccus sp. SDUM812003]MDQ8201535.1 NTP transferase domain-containing protein [Pelagicoccus sp. SDUM812003]
MKRDILGLVMCGGASRRMGEDKALLEARPGITQLEYALQLLRPFCRRLAVSVAADESSARFGGKLADSVEIVQDVPEIGGPMAGVVASLRHHKGWPVLALACDMPFLELSHLVQLLNRRDASKLATAFAGPDGGPEPFCAIYEPAALFRLEAWARDGNSSLRRFLRENPVELVESGRPMDLASVNDPESLAEARRKLGGS